MKIKHVVAGHSSDQDRVSLNTSTPVKKIWLKLTVNTSPLRVSHYSPQQSSLLQGPCSDTLDSSTKTKTKTRPASFTTGSIRLKTKTTLESMVQLLRVACTQMILCLLLLQRCKNLSFQNLSSLQDSSTTNLYGVLLHFRHFTFTPLVVNPSTNKLLTLICSWLSRVCRTSSLLGFLCKRRVYSCCLFNNKRRLNGTR